MESQETPKTSKPDWKSIVEEWKSSGLSKSEFCRRRDIIQICIQTYNNISMIHRNPVRLLTHSGFLFIDISASIS